jgi:hypothetical protein
MENPFYLFYILIQMTRFENRITRFIIQRVRFSVTISYSWSPVLRSNNRFEKWKLLFLSKAEVWDERVVCATIKCNRWENNYEGSGAKYFRITVTIALIDSLLVSCSSSVVTCQHIWATSYNTTSRQSHKCQLHFTQNKTVRMSSWINHHSYQSSQTQEGICHTSLCSH